MDADRDFANTVAVQFAITKVAHNRKFMISPRSKSSWFGWFARSLQRRPSNSSRIRQRTCTMFYSGSCGGLFFFFSRKNTPLLVELGRLDDILVIYRKTIR